MSFRFHTNYYYHPYYGHVISRFVSRPYLFMHNRHRYYSIDGHFFRYEPGIGYVLVDMPYGYTFDFLPQGYQTVFINGYVYFRVGNLFFEYTDYGFSLVHYPERYYAYDDDYYYYDDYYE